MKQQEPAFFQEMTVEDCSHPKTLILISGNKYSHFNMWYCAGSVGHGEGRILRPQILHEL